MHKETSELESRFSALEEQLALITSDHNFLVEQNQTLSHQIKTQGLTFAEENRDFRTG